MTPEQFEKRLRRLEKRVCCLSNPPAPECTIDAGPCVYTSEGWTDQTGNVTYSIYLDYEDLGGDILSSLIAWTSNDGQTPQEFLDDLNSAYSPNLVFSYDDDTDIVTVTAQNFAAACYLVLSLEQTAPEFTIIYEADTGGTGDPDYQNTLFDIPVEPGQTIYFEGTFTINTDVGFWNGASWTITEPIANELNFTWTSIITNGGDDTATGNSTGYSTGPGQGTAQTLYIKGYCTNIGAGPVSAKFQAYSTDSYFGGTYDNIFLTGSTYSYSTTPF